MHLENDLFFQILGFTLLFAGLVLIVQSLGLLKKLKIPKQNNYLISAIIGFLSGLVSIGGGIFLAPYLYLSNWDKAKQIAATSSLFILVNSTAALSSLWINSDSSWKTPELSLTSLLILSVLFGSLLGKRITFAHANPAYLRSITGILIIVVGLRILLF